MQTLKASIFTLIILLCSWTHVQGQEIDKNLIIGKWKFVKATYGQPVKDYNYNGTPQLTFEKNGRWITDDSNPNYRQQGTWKIENNDLVRDPDKFATGDGGPYIRKIDKLTATELVLSAYPLNGAPTLTFLFKRIEP